MIDLDYSRVFSCVLLVCHVCHVLSVWFSVVANNEGEVRGHVSGWCIGCSV